MYVMGTQAIFIFIFKVVPWIIIFLFEEHQNSISLDPVIASLQYILQRGKDPILLIKTKLQLF